MRPALSIFSPGCKRAAAFLAIAFLCCATSVPADQAAVYSKVKPSLALVIAHEGKGVGIGTAFCIGSHDGVAYLLTNKHVVGSDSYPQVILSSDPSSLLHGHVIRTAIVDAVVLAVHDTSCPPLTLSTAQPAVGTQVAIAGFPAIQIALSNGNLSSLSPSFHEGSVSSIAGDGSLIEYDAQTDHGNSGSPLFDMQNGVVYGLVTWVNTGKTGALQNNIAISISEMSTFLDNAHANVAYVDQAQSAPPAKATPVTTTGSLAAQPGSVAASIDVRCGSGTMVNLYKQSNKAFSELNANDYPSAAGDARTVVETASTCVILTPNGCRGAAGPCNDVPYMTVEGIQLAAQQILRVSTARMNGDSLNALRNEIMTVLDLCTSPNIMSPSQPYQSIRTFMTSTIATVQKMNRVKNASGIVDVEGVQTCAAKLGLNF